MAMVLVALLHFVGSWVSFTKSELIKPTASTAAWKSATRVLAFPLVYLGDASGTVDLFPMLMIANSVLWGIALVFIVLSAARMARRSG